MAGSAVVTTTIKLQGEDRASAEIDKAKKAVDGTAKSLENAASKSDMLQGSFGKAFSGDVLGAAKDLSGLFGGGAGLAGTLGMAAVGAGTLAVAVAGVTIEAAKWSMQLEKMRTSTEHALGKDGMERIQAMAYAAGGAAEDYGKLAGRLKLMGIDAHITAEQMAELGDRADDVGLDPKDAIQAFGDAIDTGKTKTLKAFGVYVDAEAAIQKYSKAHLVSVDAMTLADKQAAILAGITENLDKKMAKVSDTASRADDSIDRLGNTWLRLKLQLSAVVTGPLADVTESIVAATEFTIRWGKVLVELNELWMRPIITLLKAWLDSYVGLAAAANAIMHRDFAGAAEIAKTVGRNIKKDVVDDNIDAMKRLGAAFNDAIDPKKGKVKDSLDIKGRADEKGYEPDGPSPEVLDKERQRRFDKAAKDKEQAHAKALAEGKKHAEDLKKIAEQEAKNQDHWLSERLKHEKEDTDLLDRIREDSEKKFRDLTAKSATDPAARAKIRLIELEAQRTKELGKIRDATSASERDQTRAILALERSVAAEKAQIAKDEADESAKQSSQKMNDAFQIAGAVKGAMAEMGVSKRVMAGLDAAIETAEAIKSAASYDYVGAVQHGLAAAAFAAAAMHSDGASSSAGSSAGAYAPAQAAAGSGSGNGGGGHTIHMHLSGFIHGTTQQLAKDMNATLRTLAPTGFANAKGA